MQLLLRWAVSTGALYATVWILSAFGMATIEPGPWYGWFVASVMMGVVNAFIRPIAQFLAAPLNCLTFGIIGVVINGVMFWLVPVLTKSAGFPVFHVTPLGALLGAILTGLIGGLASKLIIREGEED